jgi:hypothetical protein
MLGDQGLSGLAIETDQIMLPLFVTASLDHEAKTNRDPLIANGGPHCRGVSGRLFAELCGEADGAFFQCVRDGELRHSLYKTMHGGQ